MITPLVEDVHYQWLDVFAMEDVGYLAALNLLLWMLVPVIVVWNIECF